MTNTTSGEETYTILQIILILISFETLTDFAFNELIVKMVIRHLSFQVNAIGTRSATMVGVFIEKYITLQTSHVVISLVFISLCVDNVRIKARAPFFKLTCGSAFSVKVKIWELCESKNTRYIDELILRYILILINYKLKIDAIISKESRQFHQYKIRMPSPITKQVSVH